MKSTGTALRILALAPLLLALGCGALDSAAQLERQIDEGRQLLLAGRPIDAKRSFEAALRMAPDRVEALHGFGRACAQLHLYDEALPAYEKAVGLSVRDGRIWEEYVSALASAAVVRRDPTLFETALEKAAVALYLFPSHIGIYQRLEEASAEMKARAAYLGVLTRLRGRLPDSPIPLAQLTQLRLQIARDHDLRETVAELTEQADARLEGLEASEQGLEELSPERLYLVFSLYRALGRDGRAETMLPLLERSTEGLLLTRTYRRQRLEKLIADTPDPADKLRLVSQPLNEYRPQWETDNGDYWRILELKFDILASLAQAQRHRGEPPQEGTVEDLLQTGRSLATADTSNGALWHLRTSRVLVGLGVRFEDAISVAREGMRRLRADEPGMLAPSRNEVESGSVRFGLITDLQLIEAEAHLEASHWTEAEDLLRTVLENRPSAMAHALLARSLKAQQRLEDAYPEFVSALAEGFDENHGDFTIPTRALAEETAGELGLATRLDADIERRRRQLRQNEEIRIVSDRLDQPAPEFELTDTAGRDWSSGGLRGSVVVLNFWATWCAPCLREFPSFSTLVKSYSTREDIVFLAVSIDESTAEIEPFLAEHGYSFTAVYDNGAAADFQVGQIPATVLIDKRGRVQYRTVGFPGQQRYMREMKLRIEALLRE